jgi:hypothetical protein
VIEENKGVVIAHWLQQVMANDDLRRVKLSDADRIDHVPGLLDQAITHARNGFVSLRRQNAADQHGTLRYHQRYMVAMLILEARLLQDGRAVSAAKLTAALAGEVAFGHGDMETWR